MKKTMAVFLALFLIMSFAITGCTEKSDTGNGTNTVSPAGNEETADIGSDDGDPTNIPQEATGQGFTVDWPSDALPEEFPNLGKVTSVYDFREFGNEIYINWNLMSEEEVQAVVDALNEYLDYDHAWQGDFYSDGLKYKDGSEESVLTVRIRYNPSATGEVGDNSDPQLTLEIFGEGLPEA